MWSSLSSHISTEICVVTQVETRATLANVEAIAAVDGVDGMFIGPNDLSVDMGHLGESGHPVVRAAIDEALSRIRKTGKAAGILAGIEADTHHWLDRGCLCVAVGNDAGILARQTEALAARFKIQPS